MCQKELNLRHFAKKKKKKKGSKSFHLSTALGFYLLRLYYTHTHAQSVVNLFIPVQPPLVAIRGFSRDSCLAARLPPRTQAATHAEYRHLTSQTESPWQQTFRC